MLIPEGIYLKFGIFVYTSGKDGLARDFPDLFFDGWYFQDEDGFHGPFADKEEAIDNLLGLQEGCWDDTLEGFTYEEKR